MQKNEMIYVLLVIVSIILFNIYFKETMHIIINYDNTNEHKHAELFYDTGRGFNGKDRLASKIEFGKAEFYINSFDKVKKLRIDPGTASGQLVIKEIIFIHGLNKIIIDKDNFIKAFKTNNIENIELNNNISFICTNVDPMLFLQDDEFSDVKKMTKLSNNITYIILKNILVILFYLLLYLVYKKKNIWILYINKVITSRKLTLILINIIGVSISLLFLSSIYKTYVEVQFSKDMVPFNNEIKVYQPNNGNLLINKTQFSSILISNFNNNNEIQISCDLNKFSVQNISIRQNTHLTIKINIKYDINNNMIIISNKNLNRYKIIYYIINILFFNLFITLLYLFIVRVIHKRYIMKESLIYFFILFSMIMILYNKFLIFHKYYIFIDLDGDLYTQLYPYIKNLSDYIYENKSIPFISFYAGLGFNIFTYVMELFYILVALFGPDNVPAMIGYIHALRVFLAGIFFYLFLKEKGYDNYTSTIFGLLYAFSGRMISQGMWQTYPNEVVGVALFLYAFELLYNNKNKVILPFAIAFLFLVTSSYYFVLYTIIIIVYVIFRFYIDNINPFKKINKIILIFTSYIIGFALASPLVISNLIMIRSGPRDGDFSLLTNISYLKNAIFQLTPNPEICAAFFRTLSPNIYGVTQYLGPRKLYLEDPLFYCGILTIILIPLVFNYINKREKIAYSISIGLIIIYVFSPFIRFALGGFSVSYWKISSFWIILLMLYIGSHSLSCIIKYRYVNKTMLFITSLCIISILGILGYKTDFIVLYYYIIYIFIILYSIVIFKISKKNINISMLIIINIVIIELFIMSWATMNSRNSLSLISTGYKDGTERAISFISNQDDSLFYRMEKDSQSYNSSLIQKYRGSVSYNNMAHRAEYFNALNELAIYSLGNDTRWFPSITGNVYLETLFNVKYKIIKNKYNIPYFYDIIGQEGNLFIAKNNLFIPLGTYYTENINLKSFREASIEDRRLNILKYNISSDTNNESVFQLEHNHIDEYKIDKLNMKLENKIIDIDNKSKIKIEHGKGHQFIRFNHDTNDRNVYLLKCQIKTNGASWGQISIIDNNTKATQDIYIIPGIREYVYEFSGKNYNAIEFNDSIDYEISNIELYIVPEKIYYKPLEEAVNNLKKYNFNIEKFSDNNIIGNILVDKKGTLMFSIPYDKGWTAYINDKPADLKVAQLAFLGLELEPGEYKIELKFFPPGLKAGIILFIFGVILYIIYIYAVRKEVKNASK